MSKQKTIDCRANMVTYTGRYINPAEPREQDLHIHDIAHGLSCTCRYSGQCDYFYSVAQHCCFMADRVMESSQDSRLALLALMHDAPEAYLCDMVRAVKACLGDYRHLEDTMWMAICYKYKLEKTGLLLGTGLSLPPEICDADLRMVVTERRDLINEKKAVWDLEARGYKPYEERITPWTPMTAFREFLESFEKYYQPLALVWNKELPKKL